MLSGRDAIVRFYADRLDRWSGPRIEKVVSQATDWYGFEELLWSGSRNSSTEQFRTASVFQLSEEGTIAHQMGYGTALVSI